jgi:hypothetical protein
MLCLPCGFKGSARKWGLLLDQKQFFWRGSSPRGGSEVSDVVAGDTWDRQR